MAIAIGIVGVGKIARDQHVPAIAASPSFRLAATASLQGAVDGVPAYGSTEEMLKAEPALEAVSLCQPPQHRYDAARAAILAGKHVLLEKPPGASVAEVQALVDMARHRGVSLFAAWHSREAAGVAAARAWLAKRAITAVDIVWKEDARHWHPGQEWLWQTGGLGVFDPGINALSVATHILPRPFFVKTARLYVPANKAMPIAAEVTFSDSDGAPISASLDFRQTGPQTWDIRVTTPDGLLVLSQGGNALTIAGEAQALAPEAEYAALYGRFATLISRRISDVDLAPLQQVADIFLHGDQAIVEPFQD